MPKNPVVEERTVRRDVQDLLNSASPLKANFTVIAGQDIGRKFPIQKSELSIGRGDTCEIVIDDEDVSRNHARVLIEPSAIILEDLGSTNGTLVNGVRISRHILNDGDRIQIGNLTVLKFNFFNELEDTYSETLYTAANKDFLTGLYNKKYFMDRLKTEMSHTRRHGNPLSLIIFDLDHFKSFNDKYGHVAGDNILKDMAQHISKMKRQEDLFARYGGEEFVLLLRDTPKDTAIQIAEKIRSKVSEVRFQVDQENLQVTLSVGLATFLGQNHKNEDTFIRTADQQLYRAKKAGRNRLEVEPSEA